MLNNIFSTILETGTFTGTQVLITTGTAILCGFIIAGLYMVKNKYTNAARL